MMEDRIYSNDEVATLIGFEITPKALATWPAVTLPEACIAEAMVWATQGSASDEDILHVKRARSGFRTGWGVVTAAIEKNEDASASLLVQFHLAADPWIEGPLHEEGTYLSDFVAPNFQTKFATEISELSKLNARWVNPESVCLIADFYGSWNEEEALVSATRQIAPTFAKLIRKIDVPQLVLDATAQIMVAASVLPDQRAVVDKARR